MDDGYWATPISLARNPPVAQPISRGTLAAPELLEALAGRPFCFGNREAIEKIGVKQPPFLDIRGIADREGRGILIWRQHDWHDREPVFAGEFEIALVVSGAAEDCAGAVLHQHKIGDINRNLSGLVEWMDRLHAS